MMTSHDNNDAARKRKMATARARFEKTTKEMAQEKRFGGSQAHKNEIDTMEEATYLVR